MQQKKYTVSDSYFWKITISLALASFFVFASMYAVQPLFPIFVSVFDVSVSQSSMTLSLTIIGLIAGLIILGFLSDRKGRTMFIKFSLIGSVVPFLLVPMLDSFSALLLLRLLQGFALAGLPAASLAYLNEEIDQKSIGVATALYISSNALGGMAGRVMTGYITDHYSWEIAFYFLAVIGLFVLFIVLIMLPDSRFYQESNLSFQKDLAGFLYHLKNPSLLLVFGMGIVLQLSFTGVWSFLPFHLQEEPFSLPLHAISYMFFAYGLGVIGAPLAGWVAGYFGLRKVRMIGIIILSLGIFLTLSNSLVVLVIGLCVSCLGFFTAHSLTATSVTDEALHHKGSASSLYLVAYYIGVSLGSTALAPLWENNDWIGLIIFVGCLPITYLFLVRMVSKRFAKK
ncbi:hypothetical protein X953_14290 [Virgibacillus sp. SK37]|nr:hypothetical protein X953_14290 [Virgibacillus sp. SK37]